MNLKTPMALAAGLLCFPFLASGQSFSTVLGQATVTICAPFTAGETESLAAEWAVIPAGGEVAIDPAGKPAPGQPRPAAFQIAGRKDAAFGLALPDAGDCVLTAPGATMQVKAFKVSVAGGASTTSPGGLSLDPRGLQTFKVGATMVVADNQPKSAYVGKFKLTLAYY